MGGETGKKPSLRKSTTCTARSLRTCTRTGVGAGKLHAVEHDVGACGLRLDEQDRGLKPHSGHGKRHHHQVNQHRGCGKDEEQHDQDRHQKSAPPGQRREGRSRVGRAKGSRQRGTWVNHLGRRNQDGALRTGQ